MPLDIVCTSCGETANLSGERHESGIEITCGTCGLRWERDLEPSCDRCSNEDLRPVIAAIVEKGRGTQLSVVGTRLIHLCAICDAARLRYYYDNLPNPLMPEQMPNAPGERR